MHILIHSTYFLPEVGGMEHHIYNLAVGLKKKGHHVTLITTRSNRSFPSREIIQGIQVYRKGFGGKNLIAWI
ncbi:glycosyltransferase, partial [candidate division TA06 bacterium]|nr:glycosyltransferase [candidate division TA06 bacterium]